MNTVILNNFSPEVFFSNFTKIVFVLVGFCVFDFSTPIYGCGVEVEECIESVKWFIPLPVIAVGSNIGYQRVKYELWFSQINNKSVANYTLLKQKSQVLNKYCLDVDYAKKISKNFYEYKKIKSDSNSSGVFYSSWEQIQFSNSIYIFLFIIFLFFVVWFFLSWKSYRNFRRGGDLDKYKDGIIKYTIYSVLYMLVNYLLCYHYLDNKILSVIVFILLTLTIFVLFVQSISYFYLPYRWKKYNPHFIVDMQYIKKNKLSGSETLIFPNTINLPIRLK